MSEPAPPSDPGPGSGPGRPYGPGFAPSPVPVPDDEPLMRDLIGAMLRRVRQEQGRTLREVAEAAQVSLPYLSEVERGRKEPSSEVLAAIRQALGLRLVDLVGGMHMELAAPAVVPVQGVPGSLGRGPAGGHRAVMLAA